ncbi:MAG: MAPEG family protein [Rhizobiales bacterium]|nr:MAPEG family protein [Hyphomicrobiales bacterium]
MGRHQNHPCTDRFCLGGETKVRDIALDTKAWPDKVKALGNNFDNQFDVPMLWYAACALLVATGLADWVSVALSWAFVAARIAHSVVHTGSNYVPLRMRVFLAGFAIVFLMWLWFGLRLFVLG